MRDTHYVSRNPSRATRYDTRYVLHTTCFFGRIELSKKQCMNSREIVRKAWQITQVHLKKLIWYGALPAFFSIVVSSAYITYQYNAFKHSQLFSDEVTSNALTLLRQVWDWISSNPGLTITFL